MRNILAACLLIFSCQKENSTSKTGTVPNEFKISNSYQSFSFLAQEGKAVLRVKDYLLTHGISVDSLYVNVSYSDSLCNVPADTVMANSINPCFVILNMQHKVNYDYYKKLETENARIIQENESKNEIDWTPLLVPSKPDFLKKEILVYYYFKKDSIAEIPTYGF